MKALSKANSSQKQTQETIGDGYSYIITPTIKYLNVSFPRRRESRKALDAGSKPAPDTIRGPA